MVNPLNVAERALAAGFSLSEEQATYLTTYLTLLLQWNQRMNLVGAHTWQDVFDTLVIDSFWLATFLSQLPLPQEPAPRQFWDLGAGAGLPGVPLRILWAEGNYWLVEAREKRALFLSTVLTRLPLAHTRVFRGRAEAFMGEKQAHCIISRAFMPWLQVLNLVEEHVCSQGAVIFLTNQPLKSQGIWQTHKELPYTVGTHTRYITALIKNIS